MRIGDGRLHLIAGLTVAACFSTVAIAASQFTPFSDHTSAVLEGNWQSCREPDGHYSERVYDNVLPGIGPFELHLGPNHEFALFRGVQEQHRDHASTNNLLHPYVVLVEQNRARQIWETAGLHLEVALAGGSRSECESWFVMLRRVPQPSD